MLCSRVRCEGYGRLHAAIEFGRSAVVEALERRPQARAWPCSCEEAARGSGNNKKNDDNEQPVECWYHRSPAAAGLPLILGSALRCTRGKGPSLTGVVCIFIPCFCFHFHCGSLFCRAVACRAACRLAPETSHPIPTPVSLSAPVSLWQGEVARFALCHCCHHHRHPYRILLHRQLSCTAFCWVGRYFLLRRHPFIHRRPFGPTSPLPRPPQPRKRSTLGRSRPLNCKPSLGTTSAATSTLPHTGKQCVTTLSAFVLRPGDGDILPATALTFAQPPPRPAAFFTPTRLVQAYMLALPSSIFFAHH